MGNAAQCLGDYVNLSRRSHAGGACDEMSKRWISRCVSQAFNEHHPEKTGGAASEQHGYATSFVPFSVRLFSLVHCQLCSDARFEPTGRHQTQNEVQLEFVSGLSIERVLIGHFDDQLMLQAQEI